MVARTCPSGARDGNPPAERWGWVGLISVSPHQNHLQVEMRAGKLFHVDWTYKFNRRE